MRTIYFLALATVVLSCTNKQDETYSFESQAKQKSVAS